MKGLKICTNSYMRLTEVLGGTAFFESVVDAVMHSENIDPPEQDDSFDEDFEDFEDNGDVFDSDEDEDPNETHGGEYTEEPEIEENVFDSEDARETHETFEIPETHEIDENIFDSEDKAENHETFEIPETHEIDGGEDRENEVIFDDDEADDVNIFEESGGEGKHAKIEDIANLLKKMIDDYASKDT